MMGLSSRFNATQNISPLLHSVAVFVSVFVSFIWRWVGVRNSGVSVTRALVMMEIICLAWKHHRQLPWKRGCADKKTSLASYTRYPSIHPRAMIDHTRHPPTGLTHQVRFLLLNSVRFSYLYILSTERKGMANSTASAVDTVDVNVRECSAFRYQTTVYAYMLLAIGGNLVVAATNNGGTKKVKR